MKLFNRNSPEVIKAALESETADEFLSMYSDTAANRKVLESVYADIRSNSKMSVIRMVSSGADNNEPIDLIQPIMNNKKQKEEKTVEPTSIANSRYELHDGVGVHVPNDYVEPTQVTKTTKKMAKKEQKSEEGAKTTSAKKEKKEASKVTSSAPTKQDRIKALLLEKATNKEIKAVLAEEGIKVYDSEISSAKTKLAKEEK